MVKSIDISVVIPTLNEEKRIGSCLRAIKAQKFSGNFEIIVSDSMSNDKTRKIAKRYVDKIVKEKVRTIAAGRQNGAVNARGRIIVFTDADSLVGKDWLQEICRKFNDKEIVGVYGPVFFHDGTWIDKKLSELIMPLYLRVMALLGIHSPIGSNFAVRRSIFRQVGGFDIRMKTSEDLYLGKKIIKLGRLAYAPRAVVRVSNRRVKKWGYLRYILFHISNALKYHLTGKAYEKYEIVR